MNDAALVAAQKTRLLFYKELGLLLADAKQQPTSWYEVARLARAFADAHDRVEEKAAALVHYLEHGDD